MPQTRGGRKAREYVRKAKTARGVKRVEVGFFATARYQDGTYVTNVAATHEFGAPEQGIPERPFFRLAIAAAKPDLRAVLEANVNPLTPIVGKHTAGLMGETMRTHIQRSIVDLREPPNAPSHYRKAKRSSNPLIDTGFHAPVR